MNQDEYLVDWVGDAFCCTEAQEKDLTHRLRLMFVQWMQANDTFPKFFNVENIKTIEPKEDRVVDALVNLIAQITPEKIFKFNDSSKFELKKLISKYMK